MSRQSNRKRKALQKKKRKQPRRSAVASQMQLPTMPSAQTFLRSVMLNFQIREAITQTTAHQQPSLLQRDSRKIAQIENAQTIDDVLKLAPQATGLANHIWVKRMRQFGLSAAPIIAEQFNALRLSPQHQDRTAIEEKTIEALRWCENEGIEPLLSCWNAFDDYGRSLACVALGLLDARQATDQIWAFYQQVKTDRRENLFVGALWGLIDLQDQRVADLLLELLIAEQNFYELYGFLSRAGGRKAVLPLILRIMEGPDQNKTDAMWALTSIAYRIGRTTLIEELPNTEAPLDVNADETYGKFADKIFSRSASEAEDYFSLFYAHEGTSVPDLLQQQEILH